MKIRMARTKDLVKRNLSALDERINAPYAYSDEGGYVCQYIDNLIPLYSDIGGKDFLSNPTTYSQRVGVLGQLIELLELVHHHGVSHGDLNGNNICIQTDPSSGALKVHLIDWSNFYAGDKKLPPLMAGSDGSMSYWTRMYGELPDWRSDIYSCAMKAYELLLGTPFTSGLDREQALERLKKATIPGDSLSGGRDVKSDGLTFKILSPELQTLLRSALQPESKMMPSMKEFANTLRASLNNLILCETCKAPQFWRGGMTHCQSCGHPIEAAVNLTRGSVTLPIYSLMVLGRAELNADDAVSTSHIRIHPTSFGVGKITVLGRNGLRLHRKAKPAVFVDQLQTVEVRAGEDRIEFPSLSKPFIVDVV